MRTRIDGVWAACALVTALMLTGVSCAQAATGRISFSGAVVEPTCSTVDVQISAKSAARVKPDATRQLSCGATATNPGRAYSSSVITIDSAMIGNDPLLAHLANYAPAFRSADRSARLVINTYE